jgi:hypothetical protein
LQIIGEYLRNLPEVRLIAGMVFSRDADRPVRSGFFIGNSRQIALEQGLTLRE